MEDLGILSGEYVDNRGFEGITLVQPYCEKDWLHGGRYGEETMDVEEADGGTVIMDEGVGGGREGGEVLEEREKVLTDEPFELVVDVGEGIRAGVGEGSIN